MRKIQAAFLAVALAVMALSCALMPFVPSTIGAENRLPAENPSLITEDGFNFEFPTQFEAWLRDHISLRGFWISLYTRTMRVFGASSESQVILGKGDWLFFRETLNDHTGVDRLSDDDIARLALVLDTVDAALREQGSALLLAIVPNKATVYPEYMNSAYPVHTMPSNAERLREAVHAKWIPLSDVLREHAQEGLYFHQDTHWNGLGARYGAAAILAAVEEETGVALSIPDPDAPYAIRKDWHSDLIRMLDPYTQSCEEQRYYEGKPAFTYQGRYRSPEDLTINTIGGAAPLKLLVLRDSFTNQLVEDISEAINEVTYTRAMPLPLKDAASADVVLLEMVERRLPELLQAPPVLFAPAADAPNALASAETRGIALQAEEANGGVRVFGTVENAPSALKEVLIGIRSENAETWYRAFPVSGTEDEDGNGFSALWENLPEGNEINVFMRGDTAVASGWLPLPALESSDGE